MLAVCIVRLPESVYAELTNRKFLNHRQFTKIGFNKKASSVCGTTPTVISSITSSPQKWQDPWICQKCCHRAMEISLLWTPFFCKRICGGVFATSSHTISLIQNLHSQKNNLPFAIGRKVYFDIILGIFFFLMISIFKVLCIIFSCFSVNDISKSYPIVHFLFI